VVLGDEILLLGGQTGKGKKGSDLTRQGVSLEVRKKGLTLKQRVKDASLRPGRPTSSAEEERERRESDRESRKGVLYRKKRRPP